MNIELPCNSNQRQVELVKRSKRWIFRFHDGNEAAVLAQLAKIASDPDNDFSWFDAAVLSHQIGNRLDVQMKDLMRS